MLSDISPLRFSKLGPVKNEILVYFIITGVLLLYFGRKIDTPFRYFLMSGGMILFFSGPGFWLYATLKLQSTPQETKFLRNTVEIVANHKTSRRRKNPGNGPTKKDFTKD